jgi:hypothetical protein
MNKSNFFLNGFTIGLLLAMSLSISHVIMAAENLSPDVCTADINKFGYPSACNCPKESGYNSQNGKCERDTSDIKVSTQPQKPSLDVLKALNDCPLDKIKLTTNQKKICLNKTYLLKTK